MGCHALKLEHKNLWGREQVNSRPHAFSSSFLEVQQSNIIELEMQESSTHMLRTISLRKYTNSRTPENAFVSRYVMQDSV